MREIRRMNTAGRAVLIFLLILFSLIFLVSIAFFSVTRAPSLSPGGKFDDMATVVLRPEDGATIYYTLDGERPTEQSQSTKKELTLKLDQTTTVNAFAVRPGRFKSAVISQTYEVEVFPYRPVLSIEGGTYKGTVLVYATCSQKDDVDIRYTLDGSDPTVKSPLFSENKPAIITQSATLKARSFQGELPLNRVVSQDYNIQPVEEQAKLSDLPKAGVYEGSVEIPLKGEQDGFVLYTEDGSQPDATSAIARQGEKLTFDHSVKLRLLPVHEALNPGEVVSMDYTVRNPEPLVKTLEDGSSSDKLSIEISVPGPGSVVYYTTDGSEPDGNATAVNDKKTLRITKETVLKALTKADGREDSKLFSKKYTPPVSSTGGSKQPGAKVAALTFDDGPGKFTNKLLDGLKARGVKATFFMQGVNVQRFKDEVKRMADEGHELGNHTWNHENITKLSDSEYKRILKKNNDLIESITGIRPHLFRPPGGATDKRPTPEGMTRVLWTVDTRDWQHRNEEYVYNYLVNNTKSGSIVLLHEIYDTSVNAVLRAIDTLKKQGFEFVTYSELQEYI